jgi:DNA segregation ATPase FtsK/SpoIIIE-like protein
MLDNELDDLIQDAIRIVCQYDASSASLLQRRLAIGYARAARLMDQLEALKVVSSFDGVSKPRKVLIQDAEEFIKNLPPLKLPPAENVPPPNPEYKPRKSSFLPKEFIQNKNPAEMILGTDDKGKFINTDFTKIGNLIVVGNPISKKYEFTEGFLLSILSNFATDKVNLVIYDSTYYFSKYNKIPHLLSPIIDGWDKAISALRWTMTETDRRFKNKGKYPEIYFIYNFDFTDIEREDALKRLTSMAFKAGVHLVILTDQLSDIPKSVRDNIPARLTFDKYGESKANFEFKEITPINTISVKDSEVDKYLESI